ncbi:MAG: threonine aldolase [Oceanicoccus sp.]|jgi:threonine aldolase
MITFKNDYSDGGHPKVLKALLEYAETSQPGYGDDEYTAQARKRIQEVCESPDSLVRFVSGGTQANLIVIASILRPHEAVISASSGHINMHEAGAIEATGHKVDIIDSPSGKLTPELVDIAYKRWEDCHTVKAKLVYISNTTELGTVYSKKELQDLSAYCRKNDLYLFMDGARLASALCAEGNELTLADIAELTDIFYIGGTKNGALFGEAIVITNPALQEYFDHHIKQRGALLSKGRALGVQFLTLFQDDLYFEIGRHENSMAQKLAKGIQAAGYEFLTPPVSNQIFPILPKPVIENLEKQFKFYVWEPVDEATSAIRLVSSWVTQESEVARFISAIKAPHKTQ